MKFAINKNVGLIASNLPKLIPRGFGNGIKLSKIGIKMQELVQHQIKSTDFLEGIIIGYREFLLSTIKEISKDDPESAKKLLEINLVPQIIKHEGSSNSTTFITAKQYVEDNAMKIKKRVLDSANVLNEFFEEKTNKD